MDPVTIGGVVLAVGALWWLFSGDDDDEASDLPDVTPEPGPLPPGPTPGPAPKQPILLPPVTPPPTPTPADEGISMTRKVLQSMLFNLGYTKTPTNGAINANYRKAVKAFQRDIREGQGVYEGRPDTKLILIDKGEMIIDGKAGGQTYDWVKWATNNKADFYAITFSVTGHEPGGSYYSY